MRRGIIGLAILALLSTLPGVRAQTIRLERADLPLVGGTLTGPLEIRDPADLSAEFLGQPSDFSAGWTVGGDFAISAGNAVYTHATGVGTLTQTAANAAANGGQNWSSVGINGWFLLARTLSGVAAGGPTCTVTSAFAATAQTFPMSSGTQQVQAKSSTVGDFVISCTSTAGQNATIESLSLKQMGGDLIANGSVVAGTGSASVPGLGFRAAPTLGFYMVNATTIGVSPSGGTFTSAATYVGSYQNAAGNTFLTGPSAAMWQLGAANAASPVAQTLTSQGCRGGTDTNCAGPGMTIGPTASAGSTGTAVPPPFTVNRGITTSTGTTAQAVAPGLKVCGARILSNTSATAQTLATITTTTNSGGSIILIYTVSANDGTIVDVDAGQMTVSYDNNAGTATATASATYGVANRVAAPDTLAATPTATVATNVVSLKVTPTWTNTTPTTVLGYLTIMSNGVDAVTCQ